MRVKVFCQICKEHIADADTNTLSLPLRGSMFVSKDPVHGFPAPFEPHVEWEDMECPWGPHRPFVEPNMVNTDIGVILIPQSGASLNIPEPTQPDISIPPDAPPLLPQKEISEVQEEPIDENAPAIYECQCFRCGNLWMSPVEYAEICPRCKAGKSPIEQPKGPSIHELERRHKTETEGPEEEAPAVFACGQCDRTFKSKAALYAHSRVHKKGK